MRRRDLLLLPAALALPAVARASPVTPPGAAPAATLPGAAPAATLPGAAPAATLPGAAPVATLRAPLPDARVTDHRGRRRRLVSQVIGARVVAIDFVLTGCAALCHVVSAAMAEAEALLAPRLGPDGAGLLSIGLDPIADTPAELARYAERYGAGPDWSFVTMPHAPLEQVLRRLGGPEPGGDHAPMVLVLDGRLGALWRLPGIPAPERIAAAVEAALAARGST